MYTTAAYSLFAALWIWILSRYLRPTTMAIFHRDEPDDE